MTKSQHRMLHDLVVFYGPHKAMADDGDTGEGAYRRERAMWHLHDEVVADSRAGRKW